MFHQDRGNVLLDHSEAHMIQVRADQVYRSVSSKYRPNWGTGLPVPVPEKPPNTRNVGGNRLEPLHH